MSDLTKRLREAEEAHRMARHEDGSPDEVALRDLGYDYGYLHGQSADRIDALEECLRELAAMTAAQAEDEGLWFNAMHASEGYLQQELRKLHAAIENKARALLEEK